MQYLSNAWVTRKVLNSKNGGGQDLCAQLATAQFLLEVTRRYDENQVWVVMFSENTSNPERRESAGPSDPVTTPRFFPSCRINISCNTHFTFTVQREVEFSHRWLWRGLFCVARAARTGSGPWEKKNFRSPPPPPPPSPPSKGEPAKNLYTNSEILTLSCRVTCFWSEGVNLYNRQMMILTRKTKTYAT